MRAPLLAPAAAASLALICLSTPAVVPVVATKDMASEPYSRTSRVLPAAPAPTVDTPAYASVYTVDNDAISVARVPLSLLLAGRPSIAVTVEQARPQLTVTTRPGVAGSVDKPADRVATSQVAAVGYTFLDVLGLPIQTAFAIVAGGTSGVILPTSSLIPSPYTSVYTVVNNAISVVRVPLSLVLTGQFSGIAAQTEAALNTFVTSLTRGLPDSIRGTLEYDLSVVTGFLAGRTPGSNTVGDKAVTTASASKAAGVDPAEPSSGDADEATTAEVQTAAPQLRAYTDTSTGYAERLRIAAHKETRGVQHVDGDTKADTETDTKAETGTKVDAGRATKRKAAAVGRESDAAESVTADKAGRATRADKDSGKAGKDSHKDSGGASE
ncbi:MAG: hypothetical protein WBB07_20420 [Mycobacterium sp.]